jgi:hypothetical protein
LVMWLWMRFTRSHRYYRLVKEKTRFMLVGFTKNMVVPQVLQKHNFTASRGGGITEQWSHAPLSHCSLKWTVFFSFEKPAQLILIYSHCSREQFFSFKKPVQWIDFTRTVHVNVNSNFFCFFLKLV